MADDSPRFVLLLRRKLRQELRNFNWVRKLGTVIEWQFERIRCPLGCPPSLHLWPDRAIFAARRTSMGCCAIRLQTRWSNRHLHGHGTKLGRRPVRDLRRCLLERPLLCHLWIGTGESIVVKRNPSYELRKAVAEKRTRQLLIGVDHEGGEIDQASDIGASADAS